MSVLLTGLSLGMLLFLLAAGLTLVFGLLGVVNFAHGSFYMLGAFTAWQVAQWTGSFWLALLLAPAAVGLIAAFLERLALRPVYGREASHQLLLTFGFVLVLEEVVRMIWGVHFKAVEPPAALEGTVDLLGSTVTRYRLFIIGAGIAVSLLLFWVIERTRAGIVVRAASANSAMVSCLGIRVGRVRTAVFVAGGALAALSGVIAAPLLPLKLGMSFGTIVDCFIVVVLGGIGNIRGAILAALLVGMTRAIGQQFAADWVFLLTYVLLIGTLIVRPEGLFSHARRTA